MESDTVDAVRVSEIANSSCCDEFEQVGDCVKESENLGYEFLEDLELYWKDINDRLTVSRMVSDSVIKGMVKAVEQDAGEKVAAKEVELASLRESLHSHGASTNKIGLIKSPVIQNEPKSMNYGSHLSFLDVYDKHDKMKVSLESSRIAAREQFEKLKREIDGMRGCCSAYELSGLGGFLKGNEYGNWIVTDRTLDALKMTLDTLCVQVDNMLQFSKSSLHQWQQECELQAEVEAIVIQSSFRSLQEEFEEKLWDQNVSLGDRQSMNLFEKMNQVSTLRKELDEIRKSLCCFQNEHLISHVFHDMDHFHDKAFSNHVSSSTSLWEGNGSVVDTRTDMPENFDATQLKYLEKDEILSRFNSIITKVRRDHESQMQKEVEKYFALRREYLNYKGGAPPMPPRKDKELDALKKKIPQVILKLDDILVEKEKLPAFVDNDESLISLKHRIDSLLSENYQLKNSLADRKNEVKGLASQVRNLNSDIEDVNIEFSIKEEIYKCVLKEVSGQMKRGTNDSQLELIMMQDVNGSVLGQAAVNSEMASKCEIKVPYMLSMIEQDLCNIIYEQAMKDVVQEVDEIYLKCSREIENQVSLENKLTEKENELRLEVEEKQKLKKKAILLEMIVSEREKLAMDTCATLTKERKKLGIVSQEFNDLKDHAYQQQMLISENHVELSVLKNTLEDALVQIEVDKVEINKLSQGFEQVMVELKDANEQISILALERENSLLLIQTQEQEYRKQTESLIAVTHALSKMVTGFECKALEHIKSYNLRLENSSSELNSLMNMANTLRGMGLLYKQRLERRFSDLQMAEAEVDLLGDEVDTLLGLLEKIYVALDHYSPILQHYPGIIAILKLIRRELSGEFNEAF